MPYVTAGDPDLEGTGAILRAAEAAGAAVCEVGVPFSDPVADGPVIQGSMAWALERSVTPEGVLEVVAGARAGGVQMGLVLMVSYSIVFRVGVERFMGEAASAGADGLIIPDLPFDESEAACGAAGDRGLILSQLVSPTTPLERAGRIARACTGFVYSLSRSGVTGERSALPADLAGRVGELRGVTDLPIAVGFGISTAEQVREVVGVADAAIVGSALMRLVAGCRGDGVEAVAERVGGLVAELAVGLDG